MRNSSVQLLFSLVCNNVIVKHNVFSNSVYSRKYHPRSGGPCNTGAVPPEVASGRVVRAFYTREPRRSPHAGMSNAGATSDDAGRTSVRTRTMLEEAFATFDTNGNGTLSAAEVLREAAEIPSPQYARSLCLSGVDQDRLALMRSPTHNAFLSAEPP